MNRSRIQVILAEIDGMPTLFKPSAKSTISKYRRKSKLSLWVGVAGFCLMALVATYMLCVEAPPPKKLVIASGGKSGAYYQFAQKYAAELKKEGLTLEVRETAGSVENLKLLNDDSSGVGIAIIQSGVATPEQRDQFHALGSLYREPLWVFHRSETAVNRVSDLAGKRIGVGPQGSGTYAIAMQLLAANGVADSAGSAEHAQTTLVQDRVALAAKALQNHEIDAAFFVAAFETDYIQELLKDHNVRLLSFDQQEAYHRKFRHLSQVTVPEGLVDLGHNLPYANVALIAPTAMLVAREDLHPALVPLFLNAATHIHGNGDELSNPGEFPSTAYTDFPISPDARHFYKSGPPMLQRFLPFWLASLVDRLKIMIVPLVMLLVPLVRAAPPLVRWRTRRKIYLWYSALRDIDQKLVAGMSDREIDLEFARLREIEHQVTFVEVPLSYMDEFYHLRLHLKMVSENLRNLRPPQLAAKKSA